MSIHVRTHISSSAGNCVQVDCEGASLLLDCGFPSQRAFNEVLDSIRGDLAVLISHAHRDHLSESGAKSLGKRGLGMRAHCDAMEAINRRMLVEGWRTEVTAFGALPFYVGPFCVRAIDMPHAPGFHNVAFVIECGLGTSHRKLVFCTDTYDTMAIADEMVDADFIYLESNHDVELLRRFPNPASRYHLSNASAAGTLCESVRRSRANPQAVLLGHLSEQRNLPILALDAVRDCFAAAGVALACPLVVAPARKPSDIIIVD